MNKLDHTSSWAVAQLGGDGRWQVVARFRGAARAEEYSAILRRLGLRVLACFDPQEAEYEF